MHSVRVPEDGGGVGDDTNTNWRKEKGDGRRRREAALGAPKFSLSHSHEERRVDVFVVFSSCSEVNRGPNDGRGADGTNDSLSGGGG